jgi:hypothetical protein
MIEMLLEPFAELLFELLAILAVGILRILWESREDKSEDIQLSLR